MRRPTKKRRDATRVIHQILALANSGVAKTRIVYKANLNFRLVKTYLDFLMSKGYIEKNSNIAGSDIYALTDKGKHLLAMLQKVETELDGLFSL